MAVDKLLNYIQHQTTSSFNQYLFTFIYISVTMSQFGLFIWKLIPNFYTHAYIKTKKRDTDWDKKHQKRNQKPSENFDIKMWFIDQNEI